MSDHDKATYLVRIPVGDLSGDGHDRVENHDFIIPAKFTKNILLENYSKNKGIFGFGLKDFAAEYEEFYIPREKLETLISYGYEHASSKSDRIIIGSREMAKIAMFFVGYGLDGFSYELPSSPDFTLFEHSSEPDSGIGYGVFA